MAKQTRLQRAYSALRSGKVITREKLAAAMGDTMGATQTHIRWIVGNGIKVNIVSDGRSDKSYQLVDIDKLKEACENGGRLSASKQGKVAVPKAVATAASKKSLSAKQAGKTQKRVTKAAPAPKKDKIAQDHLKDETLFEDRPASERTGKAAILDKELDIAAVSEREFNDIKSMLGIDF